MGRAARSLRLRGRMNLTLHHAHAWDVTPSRAQEIQRELAALVRLVPLAQPPRTVAGVDMSVRGGLVQAAVTVLAFPGLEPLEEAVWRGPVAFPYVPGLLSFREAPAVLESLRLLHVLPDLILADAHGIAHPRRFGLASHLGVLLDCPVIGVAKSRLVGEHEAPANQAGAHSPLVHQGETVGVALRTKSGVKPLYVSPGHRITLAEAIDYTLACTTRYRLPEPTRRAHLLSRDGSK